MYELVDGSREKFTTQSSTQAVETNCTSRCAPGPVAAAQATWNSYSYTLLEQTTTCSNIKAVEEWDERRCCNQEKITAEKSHRLVGTVLQLLQTAAQGRPAPAQQVGEVRLGRARLRKLSGEIHS